MLYASLQDKDYATSIQLLEAQAQTMMFTQIAMPNAVPMVSLSALSTHPKKMLVPRWKDVINKHNDGRYSKSNQRKP